ncbi:hypothetical protein NONI108955_20265 [Nocardia ninae]|uniref:Uncharacterized protein n=1 Tax=Nocardia ninae NBRC 108245 TaxID=1210091 RepID=A0A511MDS5_9NOCA|nr:hypothetical protein [Nocardia ninae]GEM38297.1 hypothetical protein NN4_28160 [Nocardia ninae NBRC 108245]
MNSTTTDRRAHAAAEPDSAVLAAPAVVAGLVLLIAAFATLNRIPGWADDYGAILVYLAFFLYMSLAGRLTWWGIDALYTRMKDGRSRR